MQGDTVIYDCILYKNGIAQDDAFTFKVTTNATSKDYKFSVIDGNHFKVSNKKKSSNNLDIICTSGENVYEYVITLKGAW